MSVAPRTFTEPVEDGRLSTQRTPSCSRHLQVQPAEEAGALGARSRSASSVWFAVSSSSWKQRRLSLLNNRRRTGSGWVTSRGGRHANTQTRTPGFHSARDQSCHCSPYLSRSSAGPGEGEATANRSRSAQPLFLPLPLQHRTSSIPEVYGAGNFNYDVHNNKETPKKRYSVRVIPSECMSSGGVVVFATEEKPAGNILGSFSLACPGAMVTEGVWVQCPVNNWLGCLFPQRPAWEKFLYRPALCYGRRKHRLGPRPKRL